MINVPTIHLMLPSLLAPFTQHQNQKADTERYTYHPYICQPSFGTHAPLVYIITRESDLAKHHPNPFYIYSTNIRTEYFKHAV